MLIFALVICIWLIIFVGVLNSFVETDGEKIFTFVCGLVLMSMLIGICLMLFP